MKYLPLFVALLAACSTSTGLAGSDPTLLITNRTAADTLYFTWHDGQGIAGSDVVLAGHTACEKFTARADSAYFEMTATHWFAGSPPTGSTTRYTAPWFDPTGRPNWTVDVTWSGGSPSMFVTLVSSAPC